MALGVDFDAELTKFVHTEATNSTSRTGFIPCMACINSIQHALPPPRSLAQLYQPLRLGTANAPSIDSPAWGPFCGTHAR